MKSPDHIRKLISKERQKLHAACLRLKSAMASGNEVVPARARCQVCYFKTGLQKLCRDLRIAEEFYVFNGPGVFPV